MMGELKCFFFLFGKTLLFGDDDDLPFHLAALEQKLNEGIVELCFFGEATPFKIKLDCWRSCRKCWLVDFDEVVWIGVSLYYQFWEEIVKGVRIVGQEYLIVEQGRESLVVKEHVVVMSDDAFKRILRSGDSLWCESVCRLKAEH